MVESTEGEEGGVGGRSVGRTGRDAGGIRRGEGRGRVRVRVTDGAGGMLPDGHRYRPTERDAMERGGTLEHVKGC